MKRSPYEGYEQAPGFCTGIRRRTISGRSPPPRSNSRTPRAPSNSRVPDAAEVAKSSGGGRPPQVRRPLSDAPHPRRSPSAANHVPRKFHWPHNHARPIAVPQPACVAAHNPSTGLAPVGFTLRAAFMFPRRFSYSRLALCHTFETNDSAHNAHRTRDIAPLRTRGT